MGRVDLQCLDCEVVDTIVCFFFFLIESIWGMNQLLLAGVNRANISQMDLS